MKLVTIIIPVYNVEQYLRKCLDSVVNQTYQNLQIIIVNDGTKDNSQSIIDDFANKDSRVLSLIKENGGLSDARNYALPYVKGDYIFFLDSDDSLELDAIELLVSRASNNDLIMCGFNEMSYTGKIINRVDGKEIDQTPYSQDKGILNRYPHCAWNKLYKSNLFLDTDIRFPKGLYYEDVGTTPLIYAKSTSISFINKPLINYLVDRPGNITQSVNKKIKDIVLELRIVNDWYIKENLFNNYYKQLCIFNITSIFDNLWKLQYVEDKDFVSSFVNDAYALLNNYFPNWRLYLLGLKGSIKNKIIKINKKVYIQFLQNKHN